MKVTDLLNTLEKTSDNNKNKNISKIDFLEYLLKGINNKKEIKDLILNSNLTNDQKEKLLQKFISKLDEKFNPKLNIKPLLNKNKKPKEETQIENSLLISLIQHTQNSKEIIKEIQKLPKKQQSKVVTKIKILLTNSKNTQIQKIISTKTFKDAKNFDDIINLSKKYKLNLTKIAFNQIKTSDIKNYKNIPNITEIPQNNILTSKIKEKLKFNEKYLKEPKISIKNLLQKQQIKINNKTDNLQNNINTLVDNKKTHKEINIANLLNINDKSNSKKPIKAHKSEDNNQNNQFTNSIIDNLKTQIISAKQTIKHFTSSLKEAIENYKPPVSKLTLQLHPKDLGKVEVTIKQRGENLNVQINTNNSSSINFFTTSQQELKNSLVNMGFTNINMSFNSNSNNQQKQNQQQKYSKTNQENEDEELIIDFSYKYA